MELSLETLGLDPRQPYQAHDLLSDARYLWSGTRNYVELNPQVMPAHVFRIRRRVRTERDFDTICDACDEPKSSSERSVKQHRR